MGTSSHSKRLNKLDSDTSNPSHEAALQVNPRKQYRRQHTGSTLEQKNPRPEDDAFSSMSESEEHELGPINSDAEVDEETGLTSKERQKYIKRKRQGDALDARIAVVPGRSGGGGGGGGISKEDARQADKRVFRKLIANGALIGLWYLFSLSISIYNKWMFSSDHLGFPFPLFTTSLHMVVQFLLASLVLLLIPSLRPSVPGIKSSDLSQSSTNNKPLLTPMFYLTRLVPTGTTTSFDIGLGNASLRFITLTFYTMCKSSVLIFVLMFAFLFRLEAPSIKLILIILAMTGGVLMMVAGETAFNAIGFTLAMTASFFSGFRWALTQILLLRHPATSNPFATMFFLTPIMFAALLIMALISERPGAVISGVYLLASTEGVLRTILLLFVPGCLAFCMIAAEYTLLQRTNVVTLSICGIFKEVVTISAAGIVFHDELSVVNVSGLLVTVVCIAGYNYLKVTNMRKEARKKLAENAEEIESLEDDDGLGDERRLTSSASMPLMHEGAGDEQEEEEEEDEEEEEVRRNDSLLRNETVDHVKTSDIERP